MKKLLLATAIAVSAMSTSAFAAQTSELDYDFVDIKLGQTELGELGDLETASLSFSKTVHEKIYVTGSYKYSEHEDIKNFDVDAFELKIGNSYDLQLAVPADLFVEAGFHHMKASGDIEDQGLSLEVGVKSDLGLNGVNFIASIGGKDYVEMDEESMFFKSEVFYDVSDDLSIGLAFEHETDNDVNSVEAGVRFRF